MPSAPTRTARKAVPGRSPGDVFGRVYEYFLVEFAKNKVHDDGKFFTPPSLVQTIVNVIEPVHPVEIEGAVRYFGRAGSFRAEMPDAYPAWLNPPKDDGWKRKSR